MNLNCFFLMIDGKFSADYIWGFTKKRGCRESLNLADHDFYDSPCQYCFFRLGGVVLTDVEYIMVRVPLLPQPPAQGLGYLSSPEQHSACL